MTSETENSTIYDSDRSEMLPFVPADAKRVLDVGCATGRFGGLLRAQRPEVEVWGIDPVRQCGTRESYHNWIVGSYPSDIPRATLFDCIVFNDVLEHMLDPWETLNRTKAYLDRNGAVVASIPNVRHRSVVVPLMVRGEWRYVSTGVLDRTHVRFFTRRSMVRLFHECGYRVARLEPINVSRDGKSGALNRLVRDHLVDFLARQYAIVARPEEPLLS